MSLSDQPADLGVTANAVLLLGYVAGALSLLEEPDYRVVGVDAAAGFQTLEHISSGNTYRVSVVQLTGSL